MRFYGFKYRKQLICKCCLGLCFTLCVIAFVQALRTVLSIWMSFRNMGDSANPTDLLIAPIYASELDNENYYYYRKIKIEINFNRKILKRTGRFFQQNKRSNASVGKGAYYIAANTHASFGRCKYKNCFYTSSVSTADAVLFRNEVKLMPRTPDQIWVLVKDNVDLTNTRLNKGLFNWTMSYHSMSEISYCTFGCYNRLSRRLTKAKFLKRVFTQFQNRDHQAIWLNSDCENKLRLEFAGELANFYPMRIYGQCNAFIERYIHLADKSAILVKADCNSNCEATQTAKAKFYLAFESANCSDYITEHFWRALSTGLIPVVLQPAKQYYEHIAPYSSFIHVADFDYDMKRLSAYLHRVANDLNLYSKYFRWKMNYKIVYGKAETESYRMCELCARLNIDTSRSFYTSVSTWFNAKCPPTSNALVDLFI